MRKEYGRRIEWKGNHGKEILGLRNLEGERLGEHFEA
jgi:hypothetical protein